MQRRHANMARNKLDISDRVQVRILRKRLKVSDRELAGLVQKAGSSIAAVRKEASAQRLSLKSQVPPAAVIEAIQEPAAGDQIAVVAE
jgi:hypothetical protein